MGISGLLQFIKDAAEPINVKKYKGQTVAVDTYCWLHKGAFSCAEKLAKGEPTDQYVWYCMKFVDMLLNFSVKPILVFDGRNLPSKQEVEKTRRERREANLQKGRQLLREGKLSEARDCFGRCVNITPAMAHKLIKAARERGVDCIVAPYEADAQLAYLTKSGFAQAVITEDSDLLAFGCRTVILKMDKHGNGMEIDQNNLGRCRSLGNVFTEEKFRYMCILAGCDYLPSLHGIGLGKACKLLRLAKNPDILKVIRKMGQFLKMNLVVPDQYIEGFIRANNTFLYQLVFDPEMRKVVPLNPYPEHIDPASLSYAGINLGDDKGLDMALGNLDINTLERIDDFSPDNPHSQSCKTRSNSWNNSPASAGISIWSKSFTSASAGPTSPVAHPDKSPSTRGKERVIGLHNLRLQYREQSVKRLREDSCTSDQEILQQYSASGPKRSKLELQPDKQVLSSQPRLRNCFASTTLLQRRNHESEENTNQATHSRFFSSSSSATAVNTKESTGGSEQTAKDPSQDNSLSESDGPDVPPVETPSPPVSPDGTSPPSASKGLKLFQWSGSSSSTDLSRAAKSPSGVVALLQFKYKRASSSSLQTTCQLSRDSFSPEITAEHGDYPPDSPPSQDSAYFSQSQSTSINEEEVLPYICSFSSQKKTPSERNSSADLEPEPEGPASLTETCRKSGMLGSKVSGLSKQKSSIRNQAANTPTLGPARVSGLRKKAVGPGKKCSSASNENNPGVQATISSLWKNFSYKKETVKITSCVKGEPMSPVKDNLLIPEST
ncbi:exonuclease 1 isoform X2 [Fundulus heteroclitus]|uniref:exonuclease 1 isoform X2 n=1 Tax=Fundulus heteroclitus TaxID=8078 RepID=UPI000B39838C|nr:exonuclease 1 isoform X2 [Fundulus heteroclitus]